MEQYIAGGIWIIVLLAYFYFGYRDDYKRNPKEFKQTIIAVFCGLLGGYYGGILGLIIGFLAAHQLLRIFT